MVFTELECLQSTKYFMLQELNEIKIKTQIYILLRNVGLL